MAVALELIRELRDLTGAGVLDARQALEEAQGNVEAAAEALRKKGVAKAAKKAGRETKEGLVHAYIHSTGKVGAMVAVLCETDFVARTDAFRGLVNDIALHICAASPIYVSRAHVPEEMVALERARLETDSALAGKPADVAEKIIEGKLNKWFGEVVLLDQPFVKDDTKTVGTLVAESIAVIGENIQIARFVKLELGG